MTDNIIMNFFNKDGSTNITQYTFNAKKAISANKNRILKRDVIISSVNDLFLDNAGTATSAPAIRARDDISVTKFKLYIHSPY